MGEGGALVINDPETVTKAEILREKGTNRASFLRGQVDKYTWVSYGSSYLPSDLNAAYLWAQLEQADTINTDRTNSWDYYAQELAPLAEAGLLELPTVPEGCVHNGHLFYVKLRDLEQRTEFIAYLKATVWHRLSIMCRCTAPRRASDTAALPVWMNTPQRKATA